MTLSPRTVTFGVLGVALVGCSQRVEAPTAQIELLSEGPFVAGDAVAVSGGGSTDSPENAELGLVLSYSWRFLSKPAGSAVEFADPNMPDASFAPDLYGDYTFGLVVDNGLLTSAEVTEVITVDACGNEDPEVTAITATPASPSTDEIAQFKADVADADVDTCGLVQPLAYQWTLASGPGGSEAVLNDATSLAPWLRADRPGSYVVELVVTDSTGRDSLPSSFELVVSECGDAAPDVVVTATPNAPIGGDRVELEVDATDADNDTECGLGQTVDVMSSFVSRPAGSEAALSPSEGPSPAFVADVPGTYVVRTTATDSTGRSTSVDTEVEVEDCGVSAPEVSTVDVTPALPNLGEQVVLAIAVDDPDNAIDGCALSQELEVSSAFLSRPSGSTAVLSPAEGTSPSFVGDVAGDYVVRTTVTDSTGRSATATTTVTVDACGGAAPTIDEVDVPGTVFIGDLVALDVTASDADVDSCGLTQDLTLQTEFLSRPAGSTATLAPDVGTTPSFVADVAGSYLLRTWVEDDTGLSSYADTIVVVDSCGGNLPLVDSVTPTPALPSIGEEVSLAVVTSDADNTSCGLVQVLDVWSEFVARPAGSAAELAPSEGSTPAFVPDVDGDYVVRTWVADDTGRLDFTDTTVTVDSCGSAAPEIASVVPDDSTPFTLDLVAFTVDADDDDNGLTCGLSQTLAVQSELVNLPAGSNATLSPATGDRPAFVADVPGEYVLRTWVVDDTGLADVVDTAITVSVCGSQSPDAQVEVVSPVAAGPGESVSASVVSRGSLVSLDGSASSDPDFEGVCSMTGHLDYAWSFFSRPAGSSAVFNDASLENPSFVADVSGHYVILLTVSDGTQQDEAWLDLDAELTPLVSMASGYTLDFVAGETALWNLPKGIAFDAAGDIYVVQSGAGAVTKTTTSGATTTFTAGGYLSTIEDVVYYATGDQWFVTTQTYDAIVRVSATGTQTLYAEGLNNPSGITLFTNSSGNERLVVTDDSGNNQIVFYNPASSPGSGSVGTENFGSNLSTPYGVAAAVSSGTNYYFATDSSNDELWRTNTSTDIRLSDVFGTPRDLARTPSGDLVVADSSLGAVLLVDDCGASDCDVTTIAVGPWEPWGVAFSTAGELYVTDRSGDGLYRITGAF